MRAASHREAWTEHPRFPSQALLLESHDGFLAAQEQFEERLLAIARGEGMKPRQIARFAGRLASEFKNLQWTMSCHERYEENKLYPFLAERFATDCRSLAEQHTELHELGAECERQLASAASSYEETGTLDLSEAQRQVRAFGKALESHLAEEESLVIPLLLSLTVDEFRCYSDGNSEGCSVPGSDAATG